MRSLVNRGFGFTVTALLLMTLLCRAADDEARKIRVPTYDPDNKLLSEFTARTASGIDEADIKAVGVCLKKYEDGKLITKMDSERCDYDRDTGIASSDSGIRVDHRGIIMTGVGWRASDKKVEVLDKTKLTFKRANVATNTVVTSKSMVYIHADEVAVFDGDVVVVDPQMKLTGDSLTVVLQDDAVRFITAVGKVKVVQNDRKASCKKAVYDVKLGMVLLTGQPTVSRGRDFLTGRKITFWADKDRVICEPGHLQMVLSGNSKKSVF